MYVNFGPEGIDQKISFNTDGSDEKIKSNCTPTNSGIYPKDQPKTSDNHDEN